MVSARPAPIPNAARNDPSPIAQSQTRRQRSATPLLRYVQAGLPEIEPAPDPDDVDAPLAFAY